MAQQKALVNASSREKAIQGVRRHAKFYGLTASNFKAKKSGKNDFYDVSYTTKKRKTPKKKR